MKIKECTIKLGNYENTVSVVYENGTTEDLFSYYNDELTFSPTEFIGLTKEESIDLFVKKDKEYLQS